MTEHLLEALWRSEFDDLAAIAQNGAALERFRVRDLGSQFQSLLDSVDIPVSVGGRRLVWLWSVLTGNEGRRDRLLDSVDEAERSVLDRLVGVEVPPVESTRDLPALDRARVLLDDGDFVGAVAIAESSPEDVWLIAIAVRAAFELSDEGLAAQACVLVDRVGEASLPTTPGFLRSLRDVRQLATNRCAGWAEWFSRVGSAVVWSDAADVARSLGKSWDDRELRRQSSAETAANDLLSASEGINTLQIRASLDLICDLASDLADAAGASSFTEAALLVLSMQENPSATVREAFFALIADVLMAGPSQSSYTDLVRTATTLWERVRSREAVSWALDVADLLAANPSPDPSARAGFVLSIATGVSDFASRLAIHDRLLLETLAQECGTAVALPRLPEVTMAGAIDAWAPLSGKLVGLYSLLGGVGARFAERIHVLNPAARVESNADTVSTDALRNLAATADYFIVDTRHAAHAATGGIDAARPRSSQLFPSGRGMSSFIAVLRDALEGPLFDQIA